MVLTCSGMQVLWCVCCARAIAWSLMADSESPATLFEILYLMFPTDEEIRVTYDNGCNFLNYALNRDPEWAARVRVFIDALHWKCHTKCAEPLSTGDAPFLTL